MTKMSTDNKGNAPVIVFAYNRPDNLRKTMEALSENECSKNTDVFVYLDGAKNEKDLIKVEKCAEYLKELGEEDHFKSFDVKRSGYNKGLANSVISGVTEVLCRFGRAIVLEDDIVTEKHFLSFMNECLDYYGEDKEIWSISGYTPYLRSLRKYPHDIYLSQRGSSWGWATWKDRWDLVDWNVSSFNTFIADKEAVKRFNRGGGDMTEMLNNQIEGRIDSWAIRWCYEEYLRGMLTVYPSKTFLFNTGFGESATHTKERSLREAELNHKEGWDLQKPRPDRRIARDFRLSYTDTLLKKIKRNANAEGVKKQLLRLFHRG